MWTENDGLEGTAWRWLRDVYLRLLGREHLAGMTEDQRALLLEPYHQAMEQDMVVIATLIDRGKSEALGAWRGRIHATEGTDHEMLDEALDFAMTAREPEDP